MKKLMTSTIILLPLLILAIMLVSGAIMSLITHIYVENVEFVQNDTLVLVMDDEALPPTEQLLVNIFPLKADNRTVVYSVDDDQIAAVDENGIVTAKFYGETYVSATSAENKAASAKRKLIITDDSVHKIVLNGGIATEMYEGETQSLSVSIYPKEAKNRLIHWKSSDESILRVGDNGTIQAFGAGKATVTAISDDNENVVDSIEITCYKKVTDISFDKSVVVTSLNTSVFPEVKPVPSNAKVSITYSSSDERIASVDKEGKITFHKAGRVKIFAHATDFGGKIIDGGKEYISTDGYFIPALFKAKEYTVNYDEYGTENPLPVSFTVAPDGAYRKVTSVVCDPEGQLSFDEKSMTFRFAKEMPVGKTYVDVTVYAIVYDMETQDITEKYEDWFRVNVERDAKDVQASYNGTVVSSIQTKLSRLTFTTLNNAGTALINVNVTPKNHTNTISYELLEGSDVAEIDYDALSFQEEGVVKVKIVVKNAKDEVKASFELTVTYTPHKPGDVSLKVDENSTEEIKTSLNLFANGGKDTGVIYFTKPADSEVEYSILHGNDVVKLIEPDEEDGNWKIEPLKGGFAEIQISAAYNAPSGLFLAKSGERIWTIEIYVDRPVSASDFEISFNGKSCKDSFRTSLTKVSYHVDLKDNNGSFEGKELTVTLPNGSDQGGHSLSGEVFFKDSDEMTLVFGVAYSEQVPESHKKEGTGLTSVTRSLSTTRGTLDEAPAIKFGDKNITNGEHLTLGDLGETLTLTVEESFNPSDFVLSDHRPTIDSNECITAKVSDDGKSITLTSVNACTDKEMILTVGGKTYQLFVSVVAKANTISVVCCDKPLEAETTYKTLLKKLAFEVKIGRGDGKEPTNPNIEYRFDGEENWKLAEFTEGKITLDIKAGESWIYFRSQDQGVDIGLKFTREIPEDFGLEVGYFAAEDGKLVVLDTFNSVNEAKEASYVLPAIIQNSLNMRVILKEEYLGGLGTDEDFEEIFKTKFEEEEGITVSHNAPSSSIILTFQGESFQKEIEISCGEAKMTLKLARINLVSISLTGFDSNNASDVYRGYQQVRVFAKHSYYGDQKVDYFKVPYVALTDLANNTPIAPEHVYWQMKKVTDGQQDVILASQRGNIVTVGEEKYKIMPEDGSEGDSALENEDGTKTYVLKDKDGNIVSGKDGKNDKNIPWIDVFSEKGVARVYFGNFKGLSETDVQNDYFGNFGEKEGWQKVEEKADDYDKSGRKFKASEGAYSFLSVEGGDGAEKSSVNAHFNFNVLEDKTIEGTNGAENKTVELVNVFNATGYYANQYLVLHADLYGDGELDNDEELKKKAQENDQILDRKVTGNQHDSAYQKNTIYGNGYQVNLEMMNRRITQGVDGDGKHLLNDDKGGGQLENNSNNTDLFYLYNVTLLGANPGTKITRMTCGFFFVCKYIYYTDLQYYGKLQSWSPMYIKNSSLRNIAGEALEAYNDANNKDRHAQYYLENVAIVHATKGITVQGFQGSDKSKHALNINGFFDVLNYSTMKGLINIVPPAYQFLAGSVFMEVYPYVEWFGNSLSNLNTNSADAFVNPVIIDSSDPNGKALAIMRWNNDTAQYDDMTKKPGDDKTAMKLALDFMGLLHVYAYNADTTVDGGKVSGTTGTREKPSKLFTSEREIRVLCEYLDIDNETKEPILNTDHIRWHMEKCYRDPSLIAGRTTDHEEALKESLQKAKDEGKWDGEWPDGTKLEDALNPSVANAKAILPTKRKFEEQ